MTVPGPVTGQSPIEIEGDAMLFLLKPNIMSLLERDQEKTKKAMTVCSFK